MFIFSTHIDLVSRAFANGPGDRGSIPGRVIPKTQILFVDKDLKYKFIFFTCYIINTKLQKSNNYCYPWMEGKMVDSN